ncbi:hypothetical protein DFH08DRAFT_1081904 [Mycena albidolilacea]|uniref:Uncharacterized protein n=1 Tax=Mycena albidolilacea TaxID=1033008 RepID=A0AAD6ZXF2_9AGAR|nr:hypothetical protein DFH08DRAFT_1081904 [Mycena albidolilacea]
MRLHIVRSRRGHACARPRHNTHTPSHAPFGRCPRHGATTISATPRPTAEPAHPHTVCVSHRSCNASSPPDTTPPNPVSPSPAFLRPRSSSEGGATRSGWFVGSTHTTRAYRAHEGHELHQAPAPIGSTTRRVPRERQGLSSTFSEAEERRKKGSPANTNSTTRYALAAARSRMLLVHARRGREYNLQPPVRGEPLLSMPAPCVGLLRPLPLLRIQVKLEAQRISNALSMSRTSSPNRWEETGDTKELLIFLTRSCAPSLLHTFLSSIYGTQQPRLSTPSAAPVILPARRGSSLPLLSHSPILVNSAFRSLERSTTRAMTTSVYSLNASIVIRRVHSSRALARSHRVRPQQAAPRRISMGRNNSNPAPSKHQTREHHQPAHTSKEEGVEVAHPAARPVSKRDGATNAPPAVTSDPTPHPTANTRRRRYGYDLVTSTPDHGVVYTLRRRLLLLLLLPLPLPLPLPLLLLLNGRDRAQNDTIRDRHSHKVHECGETHAHLEPENTKRLPQQKEKEKETKMRHTHLYFRLAQHAPTVAAATRVLEKRPSDPAKATLNRSPQRNKADMQTRPKRSSHAAFLLVRVVTTPHLNQFPAKSSLQRNAPGSHFPQLGSAIPPLLSDHKRTQRELLQPNVFADMSIVPESRYEWVNGGRKKAIKGESDSLGICGLWISSSEYLS